jgi:hypothetical protein
MILSLLLATTAFPAILENLSLKTTAPGNDFALCAMQTANAEVIHSNGTVKLLNSELETLTFTPADSTSGKGALRFYVMEPNARIQIFRLIFRAPEGARWRMEPVPGEKPYAFSPSSESLARIVTDDDYFYVGEVDTASCR